MKKILSQLYVLVGTKSIIWYKSIGFHWQNKTMFEDIRHFLELRSKEFKDANPWENPYKDIVPLEPVVDGEDQHGNYIECFLQKRSNDDGVLRAYIIRFYHDMRPDGSHLVRHQINHNLICMGYPSKKFCSSVEEFKQIFERFLETV
jgi:hypothetical protein